MNKRHDGFTLIELLVAMVMFVLVISAASSVFTSLLTQFKQQSKISETNIEGIIGLDILRIDIEHAGYGLPWNVKGDITNWGGLTGYSEAKTLSSVTPDPASFNDSGAAPRAILSDEDADFNGASDIFDGSDYLVIKSSNIAISVTAQTWTHQRTKDSGGEFKRPGLSGDLFDDDDRVVVIFTGSTDANSRSLVVSGGAGGWYTTYGATLGFAPDNINDTNLIYGIDPDTSLRMPFNRADYYIWRKTVTEATDEVPDRCAPNTGVFRKAVISQNNGQREAPLPLIDCVADFQVVYRLDMNGDGQIGTSSNADGSAIADVNGGEGALIDTVQATFASASLLRTRLKEVGVYILAHEGQRDPNFTFTNFTCVGNCIIVGPATGEGRDFDFDNTTITNWENYRWKVYTLVVKIEDLG